MKEGRILVDFTEMLEDGVIPITDADWVADSFGNKIKLKEGLTVKVYSVDFSSCSEEDNLIAEGVVELNTNPVYYSKWNCRIIKSGVYNESQGDKM